jgi:hypothetical protein
MSINESDLEHGSTQDEELLDRASKLEARDKIALVCKLISGLETAQIQELLEFTQQEIAARQGCAQEAATPTIRQTTLLLKKDYSYQKRGLSQPTQYFVYLRRRKPKLDRYIGTLFYIHEGSPLSYYPDAEGRIVFTSPHNLFLLTDLTNRSVQQVVKLICLEPPPPEYTFTKQQDDTPEIYLRLEYLDPQSYQLISEESYSFPFCMYGGGPLDRYRWDVTPLILPSDPSAKSMPGKNLYSSKF